MPEDGPTRRTLLNGMLGAAIATTAPVQSARALSEGPPPFGTARHQFTILRPAKTLPPVPVTRLDGVTTDFGRFRGKLLLVNFWATWCPACRTELPLLERLQATSNSHDVNVLAISTDRGGRSVVAPFVRDVKIKGLSVYLDPDGRIARPTSGNDAETPFVLYAMPITYLVSGAGRVEGYLAGEADWTSDGARDLLAYYASRPS